MEKKIESKNNGKLNKFQFFLYGGVIPLFLSTIIIVLLLQLFGYNVAEKVKSIPVVKSYIEKREKENTLELYENRLEDLNIRLQKEKNTIKELENKLKKKEQEIARLVSEREQLEHEIAQATTVQSGMKEVVLIYEKMSPENIANILVEMDANTAVAILEQLSESKVSKVLEKLPPRQAAQFTAKLAE